MRAYARWCLRSKKASLLCIMVPTIFLIAYYYFEREITLDQSLTRRASVEFSGLPLGNGQRVIPPTLAHAIKSNIKPARQKIKSNKNKLISPKSLINREDIIEYVERRIQEAMKEDKGTGCEVPKLDPFAPEMTKFNKAEPQIVCTGIDWVYCKFNLCRVKPVILNQVTDIECVYQDIIYVSDASYHLGKATVVRGSEEYELKKSDSAQVSCKGRGAFSKWTGLVIGFRKIERRDVRLGRDRTPNILILGFDSTSKNGFIRRMPHSYKVLTDELDAIVLQSYNIVGDGTPAALLPILTGRTELELPEMRKRLGSRGHLDTFPFLWYTLAGDGYQTAYFEDSPWIGTFQYRFTGFQHQPTDHYLRSFFTQYHSNRGRYAHGKNNWYCIGDTPSHALMMNLTKQFMHIDGNRKKFIFTFIADITHDNFNYISNADDRLVQWLRDIKDEGILDNTLLIVMGDHGPRYEDVRNTLQGKLEERLPLMAFVLPKTFTQSHREAVENLKSNADVLTTPFDLYNTLLDLVGLQDLQDTTKIEGSDLPRSMSLFHKIPSNRSCSEAGIEPHWCTCLKWQTVEPADQMFHRGGTALLDYINQLTEDERVKCTLRTLTAIDTVSQRTANPNLLAFKKNKDVDGYIGSFDAKMKISTRHYQVKIIVGPGKGIYEASMTYNSETDKFHLTNRDISRINAYRNEPQCISATRPDLNMYCYCRSSWLSHV